jgi:hypothetical protein
MRGVPKHIRSDNGPEFIANAIRKWTEQLGIETLYTREPLAERLCRKLPWQIARLVPGFGGVREFSRGTEADHGLEG